MSVRTGVRSFVAVPLPAQARTAIQAAAQDLSARLPDVRWSRKAANLHVTLRFLGQVDEALLGRFAAALAEALGSGPGFDIALRGMGAFPSPADARVIWVGVEDPSRRLADVAGVVAAVADRFALGVPPKGDGHGDGDGDGDGDDEDGAPARAFRAHVTLGRTARRTRPGIDAQAALQPWSERAFGTVSVREIHVYESITGGDASTYILRGTARLQPC